FFVFPGRRPALSRGRRSAFFEPAIWRPIISGSAIEPLRSFGMPEKTRNEVDTARIERAVREILLAVGENPDREGLAETPARVARSYAELFAGLYLDPRRHLKKFFTEHYDEVVLVRDIS